MITIIVILVAGWVLFSGVVVLSACMSSSQFSQREAERRDKRQADNGYTDRPRAGVRRRAGFH